MIDVTALDRVIAPAHRVRVTEVVAADPEPADGRIAAGTPLLDEDDPAALAELRDALVVRRGERHPCRCHVAVVFEFLDGGGRRLTTLELHLGRSVRWDGWSGEAELASVAVLEWLALRGAPGPLADWLDRRRQHGAGRRTGERHQLTD